MNAAHAGRTDAQRRALRVAIVAWLALLALCIAWESVLAPLRPGGSWLVLKALPLLLPLRGVLRGDPATMQWALLLDLLYVAEGAVRIFEPAPFAYGAVAELLFAGAFFAAALVYLHPYKKAARANRAARSEAR
jgi:uncharacterized membrane protein